MSYSWNIIVKLGLWNNDEIKPTWNASDIFKIARGLPNLGSIICNLTGPESTQCCLGNTSIQARHFNVCKRYCLIAQNMYCSSKVFWLSTIHADEHCLRCFHVYSRSDNHFVHGLLYPQLCGFRKFWMAEGQLLLLCFSWRSWTMADGERTEKAQSPVVRTSGGPERGFLSLGPYRF